jgi:hypothetical protein
VVNTDTCINYLLTQIKKLEIKYCPRIKNKYKSIEVKEDDKEKFNMKKVLMRIEEEEKEIPIKPLFHKVQKLIENYEKVKVN